MKWTPLFALALLIPVQAQASSFMQCKVEASILKADAANGVYTISVLDSITTGGQAEPGQPCLKAGHETEIETKDELPEQGDVMLYYSYSDGMGPNGLVVSKEWTTKNPQEPLE